MVKIHEIGDSIVTVPIAAQKTGLDQREIYYLARAGKIWFEDKPGPDGTRRPVRHVNLSDSELIEAVRIIRAKKRLFKEDREEPKGFVPDPMIQWSPTWVRIQDWVRDLFFEWQQTMPAPKGPNVNKFLHEQGFPSTHQTGEKWSDNRGAMKAGFRIMRKMFEED